MALNNYLVSMLCLYFNTASRKNHIALVEDNFLLNEQSWESNRDETEKLLNFIENLLISADKEFKDLNHIFAISGPGGFTSIRVGVTIANSLAYSLNAKIASATLFDLHSSAIEKKDYLLVHSATKREIFVQGKGIFKKYSPEIEAQDVSKLFNFFNQNRGIPFKGELLESHLEKIIELQGKTLESKQNAFLQLIKNADFKHETTLEPFYGRMGQIN